MKKTPEIKQNFWKVRRNCIILTMLVIIFMVSFTGCIQENLVLDAVEVREYEGEKLSSVNDFRENSIKGPQNIELEDYQLKIKLFKSSCLTQS